MNTILMPEDDVCDLLMLLWMMSAVLDQSRQLLQQAQYHLPGELRYEAQSQLSSIAFISGVAQLFEKMEQLSMFEMPVKRTVHYD